jgi:DNA-directed RNA polymerase specialized sigma24 family protein
VLKLDLLGYNDDEIANAIGETVGYVYQLRRRGLLKLKEVLGDVDP